MLLASGVAFMLNRPLSKRTLALLSLMVMANGVLVLLSVTPYLKFCEPIDRLKVTNLSFWDYFANWIIWACSVVFGFLSYVKRAKE